MAVSATAKSLINSDSYSNKWHQKRIHRKLDDRDDVLDEALQILESHDASALPRIVSITGFATSTGGGSSAAVITVGGAGCTATSTVSLTIGATTIANITAGTNTVTADNTAGEVEVDAVMAAASAGDFLPVYLVVDSVLCPVMSLLVTA